LSASTWLGIGGVAAAAPPGVTIDPHGPAGTEYAIPLERARSDYGGSSPSSTSGGSTGASTPTQARAAALSALFGAGIERRARPARPIGRPDPPSGRDDSTAPDVRGLRAAAQPVSATATSAGIVAGVLLLGLGFGALLRLRRPEG
jgi:hypothetical protein